MSFIFVDPRDGQVKLTCGRLLRPAHAFMGWSERGNVVSLWFGWFLSFLLWLVRVSFAFTYLLVLGICDHSLTFITPPHCVCHCVRVCMRVCNMQTFVHRSVFFYVFMCIVWSLPLSSWTMVFQRELPQTPTHTLMCTLVVSTFSPVGLLSSDGLRMCVCVCVDGMNLKYVLRWHISTYQFIPSTSTHTHASSNHLRIANRQG